MCRQLIEYKQGAERESNMISNLCTKRRYHTTNIPKEFWEASGFFLPFLRRNNRCRVFPIMTTFVKKGRKHEFIILQEKALLGGTIGKVVLFNP